MISYVSVWYLCGYYVACRRRAQAIAHFLQMGFAQYTMAWLERESFAPQPKRPGLRAIGVRLRYDQAQRLHKRRWLRAKGRL